MKKICSKSLKSTFWSWTMQKVFQQQLHQVVAVVVVRVGQPHVHHVHQVVLKAQCNHLVKKRKEHKIKKETREISKGLSSVFYRTKSFQFYLDSLIRKMVQLVPIYLFDLNLFSESLNISDLKMPNKVSIILLSILFLCNILFQHNYHL